MSTSGHFLQILGCTRYVLPALLIVALRTPGLAGQVTDVASLAEDDLITSVRLDAEGNVYLTGLLYSPNARPENLSDAFVAKLAADGTQIYRTVLATSANESADALELAPDGTVYVAGTTFSRNFPTTAGALQSTLGAADGGQAFLVRLSADGQILSSTYFGGSAETSGRALALDPAGEVYVTGRTIGDGFPATPGHDGEGNGFFLAKVDSGLTTVLFATRAYGGSELTLDGEGNILVAGAAQDPLGAPFQTTVGAFQRGVEVRVCRGSGAAVFPCDYQFVQKLNPEATELLYSTFLSGAFGATPAGISVDADGNAIVAGTTNSSDYPVTEGAFQTAYPARATPPQVTIGRPTVYPPPATGYVTKLNTAGTDLIWSTYFGGSGQDAIADLALGHDGSILLAGPANSPDLPGLSASVPAGCRPSPNQGLGFVARLSADGAHVSAAQLVYGRPTCLYGSCFTNNLLTSAGGFDVAAKPDGNVVWASGGSLAEVDLAASDRLACVADPTDNTQLTTVAPGQALTLFGSSIGPAEGGVPPGGAATSFQGIEVTFDGLAAPILYAMGDQINVQAPYEIASRDSVEIEVVNGSQGWRASKNLAVVPRQPSVFLSAEALLSEFAGLTYCGLTVGSTPYALALNGDGTVNSCENGAPPRSTVTVFLNGMGPTEPAQPAGVIPAGSPLAIAPGATGPGVVSTANLPGSISGVAQVQIQVGDDGFVDVLPTVDGVAARQPVAVWVGPSPR